MPLTAAYELCVVNWKSLHMLLTNKLQNISVWRASLCYYCMNVDYSLIHHFFFFIEEGERIKTLDQKRNMQFEWDLIGVVLCLLSTCI